MSILCDAGRGGGQERAGEGRRGDHRTAAIVSLTSATAAAPGIMRNKRHFPSHYSPMNIDTKSAAFHVMTRRASLGSNRLV